MIVIWREDTDEINFTFAEFANYLELSDEQGLTLNLCVPFPSQMNQPIVISEGAENPTDYFGAGVGNIVSDRLKSLLERRFPRSGN